MRALRDKRPFQDLRAWDRASAIALILSMAGLPGATRAEAPVTSLDLKPGTGADVRGDRQGRARHARPRAARETGDRRAEGRSGERQRGQAGALPPRLSHIR
jgi:hypothetical protein